jgi:hypothetical protein
MTMLYQRLDALNNHLMSLEEEVGNLKSLLATFNECLSNQISSTESRLADFNERLTTHAEFAAKREESLKERMDKLEAVLPTIDGKRLIEVEDTAENLDGDLCGLSARVDKLEKHMTNARRVIVYPDSITERANYIEKLVAGPKPHEGAAQAAATPVLDAIKAAPVNLSRKVPKGGGRPVAKHDLPNISTGLILYTKCPGRHPEDPIQYRMVVIQSDGRVVVVDKTGSVCATNTYTGGEDKHLLKQYSFALDRGPFGSAGHLWSEVSGESS